MSEISEWSVLQFLSMFLERLKIKVLNIEHCWMVFNLMLGFSHCSMFKDHF